MKESSINMLAKQNPTKNLLAWNLDSNEFVFGCKFFNLNEAATIGRHILRKKKIADSATSQAQNIF